MKIHWLQHVEFENLGSIESWIEREGHELSGTKLYLGDELPEIASIDMLIVMGGPMGIYDYEDYSWLLEEAEFIKSAIDNDIIILGICLGAQLLAHALGAKVFKNKEKEIGWFPIRQSEGLPESLSLIIPEEQTVFHWHGDTFDLPKGGKHLSYSQACKNQGFIYGEKIIGLQYHLETTVVGVNNLLANCGDELVESRWIQNKEEVLAGVDKCENLNRTMNDLLDFLSTNKKH